MKALANCWILFIVLSGCTYTGWTENSNTDSVQAVQSQINFRTSSITDGDTFRLLNNEKVRLLGINTPETGQACATEAKEKLKELIQGKELKLESDAVDTDQYGRLLRYVYVNDMFVNLELVKQGYAHKYNLEPNNKYAKQFEEAENYAKQNNGCIWKTGTEKYVLDQCIQITEFHYNEGTDQGENLNNEFVKFENTCNYLIDMKNWTVKDESSSHLYTFENFIAQPNLEFSLFTGEGKNTSTEVYWGRKAGKYQAIWNNTGDTLFLRDQEGNLIVSEGYGN